MIRVARDTPPFYDSNTRPVLFPDPFTVHKKQRGGTITKVHERDFDYKGHRHRASADDPQYEIKSDKTDHIAAHRGAVLRKAAALANAAGLPPKALHIEITEHHIIDDHDAAAIALSELRSAGVGVALDDFGAGFASLGWLARFPADILKIDAYFIRAMEESDAARKIIRAITALAHELGLTVIAEGVESPDAPARLRDLGCDFAQGHFYGGAVEPDEAELRYLRPAH